MLETLISSKTRIKLLLKFFLNSNATAYLRNLESEFGESTNAIRLELNKFENRGLLISEMQGNKKIFRANIKHPLFKEIHNIVLKHTGIDNIIEYVIRKLGAVKKVYLIGKFSKGLDSDVIDLILIGDIDKAFLITLIDKTEKMVNRKIRYLIYSEKEFLKVDLSLYKPEPLLLWNDA